MNSFSTTGLLIFSALLGSAFTIMCKESYCLNQNQCQEVNIECGGNPCLTASQYYKNDDLEITSFYKGCANETNICDLYGSVTQDKVNVRVLGQCCTEDFCNNGTFYLPSEDDTPNGVICPSCYSRGTLQKCVSDTFMNCFGSETKCVDYSGKVRNPDMSEDEYSVKGCINDIGCIYSFTLLVGIEEQCRTHLIC